jgi:LuxR family maltose regulon positive regulatory protein
MQTPILTTKLYIPRLQPNSVSRPSLLERLNEGLHRRLTLISAPAGIGKTTLVSSWVACIERPTAWLSLDDQENDPARFLTYFVAAVQTIAATIGEGVLDDYHTIAARPIDHALTYLVEHLPPRMHLVIATREDPVLPLARLRARGYLTELRAADLRFTPAEAAAFLTQVMGLHLSGEDVAALETRTEGWIAGLQFAALSLTGCQVPCVMPLGLAPLVPGKKPWNISNTLTCSSSPWTTSGTGIATTSSSLSCYGSDSSKASPPLQAKDCPGCQTRNLVGHIFRYTGLVSCR